MAEAQGICSVRAEKQKLVLSLLDHTDDDEVLMKMRYDI